ncbi:unnamed protein product [Durusdinium trenchii]|uniref:Fe2OG dioxygenase domain-containing protein n=1 Tax=Durusdinium trenchii TaxID=1381693 RepID=A0ABP0SIT9_9DINO
MFAFDELDQQEAEALQHATQDVTEVQGLIDFDELAEAENARKEETTSSCKRRCMAERAQPSRGAATQGIGIYYGLALPRSAPELLGAGANWLSRAFWQAKTFPEELAVSQIIALRPLSGGSYLLEVTLTSGGLLMLAVNFFKEGCRKDEISGVRPKASGGFFFGVNFLRLLECELPVPAKYCFGDVCDKGSAGILITEWSRVTCTPLSFCSSPKWGLLEPRQSCFLSPLGHEQLCLQGNPASFGLPTLGALGLGFKPACEIEDQWHQKSWTLAQVDDGLWQLLSSDGRLLFAANAGAQALQLQKPSQPGKRRHELWQVLPAGQNGYYIQSYYETFLSHSAGNSVFMSPAARANARWSIETLAELAQESEQLTPLDLRGEEGEGLDLHMMKQLIVQFAELAGRCVAQNVQLDIDTNEDAERRQAEDEATAFRRELRERFTKLQSCDSPRAQLGFQDSEFLDKASVAQEFITRLAVHLFPSGTVNKQFMKDYRAALVTARVNFFPICAFLSLHVEYSACGLEFLRMDSLYWSQRKSTETALAIQHWGEMTHGPVGFKLWRWLALASPQVLHKSFVDLIQLFIDKFAATCQRDLDKETLIWHVLLAASLHSVELLDAVPVLLEQIPKKDWPSITSWQDPRLLRAERADEMWMVLKAFVSTAVVTQRFDLVNRMVHEIPEVLRTHAWILNVIREDSKNWQPVRIGLGQRPTEVHATDAPTSEILTVIPPQCTGYAMVQDMDNSKGVELVEICIPINGFVRSASLTSCDVSELPTKEDPPAWLELLSLMYHTRRQYTGNSGPLFMDEISAKKLCDEIHLREKASSLITRLGHGTCSVVHGSFLAETELKPWWPPKYEDWAYHSFVLFEDGHIADLTADQFDCYVPQLWYPAKLERYDRSSHRAEAARFTRQVTVGLDKWRSFVEEDRSTSGLLEKAPRRIYDWWDAEMKGGFDVRHGQQGQVLRYGKSLSIPEPYDVQYVNDRRVVFRRLTGPEELKVSLVEGLFEGFELQRLLSLCEERQGFQPSLQKDRFGQVVQDGRRTSHSCAMRWPLLGDEDEVELRYAQEATERCAAALGLKAEYIEPLQLVKYTPGQYYRAHLDTHQEPERLGSFNGEQRMQTLLVFVSSVPESDGGGHLHFPLLELRILPKAGTAVLWDNCKPKDGTGVMEPDPCSLHEGEPPLHVNKVAMNVWVVDQPFTKQSVQEAALRRAGYPKAAEGLREEKENGDVKK